MIDFKVIQSLGKIEGKEPKDASWSKAWYEFDQMEYKGIVFYRRAKYCVKVDKRLGHSEVVMTSSSYAFSLDAKKWISSKWIFKNEISDCGF